MRPGAASKKKARRLSRNDGRPWAAIGVKGAAGLRRDPVVRAVCGAVGGSRSVFLVGGVVRDILLKRPRGRDYDFAVSGPVGAAARRVAEAIGGTAFPLGKKTRSHRVAARLNGAQCTVDLSPMEGGGIISDLKRRDFTVNAVALDARAVMDPGRRVELIDPCGGARDAASGLLRMTGAPALRRDPVRCLRAVRIAAECGLAIDGQTAEAVRRAAGLISKSARERVKDELVLIFSSDAAASSGRALHDLGIAEVVLPETAGWRDVNGYKLLDHVLKSLEEASILLGEIRSGVFPVYSRELRERYFPSDAPEASAPGALSRAALLRMAAYLHDAGKPMTIERSGGALRFWGHDKVGAEAVKKALTRLRFSRKSAVELSSLVANHHRPFGLALLKDPGRRALSHFFTASGGEAGVDCLMLALSDARATRGSEDPELLMTVLDALGFYYREYSAAAAASRRPVLTGREIMAALKIPEGPLVGRIMRAVAEGVEAGEVRGKSQAIDAAKRALEAASGPIDKGTAR